MKKLVWTIALALILGLNLVLPGWHERDLQVPHEGPRSRADVLLDVFGEARTVIARWLWFKMDLMHEHLDRMGVPHEQQTDLIPYLRLVTLFDHRNDDAYDIIANDLYHGNDRPERGHEVVDEGLGYNPKSPRLLLRKALFLVAEKRWNEAVPVVNRGLEAATERFDLLNLAALGFHAEQGLKHPDRAEHYVRVMFSVDPGSPRAAALWRELKGSDPPQDIQYPGT